METVLAIICVLLCILIYFIKKLTDLISEQNEVIIKKELEIKEEILIKLDDIYESTQKILYDGMGYEDKNPMDEFMSDD